MEKFPDQSSRSASARASERADYARFAAKHIDPEYKTCSLSKAIGRSFSGEFADLAEMLKRVEREDKREGLYGALYPVRGQVVGRGEEAVCFCLPPSELLLKNSEFEFTLVDALYDRANLREMILSEYPADYPGLPSLRGAVNRQIEFIMRNLPVELVVKLVSPEGGSWNSSWGYRPHDTPMYLWQELGGSYYVVVQEQLSPIESIAPLEETLGPEYQVVDPIGTVQRGKNALGTGQSGYNRFQQVKCFDYSAVGLVGEDSSKRMRSSRRDQDGTLESMGMEDRGQLRSEQLSRGIGDRSGDRVKRQLDALSGAGEFWGSGANAELLRLLIADSVDDRVPDPESIESLVMLTAIRQSGTESYENTANSIRRNMQRVVKQALRERLLRP